jgi:plasmid stabilization system protein ParE
MRIVWTNEALSDFEDILAYYYLHAGVATAGLIERRIAEQLEKLLDFPGRVRTSERIPGAREVVINRLPYIAFIRVSADEIQTLNIVHTARRFPA